MAIAAHNGSRDIAPPVKHTNIAVGDEAKQMLVTDIAVISLSGIVYAKTVRVALERTPPELSAPLFSRVGNG